MRDYIKSLQESLQKIHNIIVKNKNMKEQKEFQSTPYDVSTKVVAKIFLPVHGLQYRRYEGPYAIIRRKQWCYWPTLKHLKSGKIIDRNHYHLKKFVHVRGGAGTSIESVTRGENRDVGRRKVTRKGENKRMRYPECMDSR